jgi:hypothetical protein
VTKIQCLLVASTNSGTLTQCFSNGGTQKEGRLLAIEEILELLFSLIKT